MDMKKSNLFITVIFSMTLMVVVLVVTEIHYDKSKMEKVNQRTQDMYQADESLEIKITKLWMGEYSIEDARKVREDFLKSDDTVVIDGQAVTIKDIDRHLKRIEAKEKGLPSEAIE